MSKTYMSKVNEIEAYMFHIGLTSIKRFSNKLKFKGPPFVDKIANEENIHSWFWYKLRPAQVKILSRFDFTLVMINFSEKNI